jgi:ATP-dependent Clp protease ATP-binding subunit ClpB
MEMDKFTTKSREALLAAQHVAVERGHQELRPIHVLKALCEQDGGLVPSLLKRLNVDASRLNERIDKELAAIASVSGPGAQQTYQSRDFSKILLTAKGKAEQMKDEYISVEHLLLALIDDDPKCRRVLEEEGASKDKLLAALKDVRGNQRVSSENPKPPTRLSKNTAATSPKSRARASSTRS